MTQELLLLGLLLDEKKHGYQLNEHFKHTLSFCADLKQSTAYYVLNKLEKEGHVEQEIEREGNRPERRVYQITDKGRLLFLDLLRRQLGGFERTYYDDDVGISFMDQLSTAEVRQLLAEKREKIQTLLQQFREHPEHGKNWRYVLSHNSAHLEADLSWISKILEDIERRSDNNDE